MTNIFNEFYAKDMSRKIRAVFKNKGNSGNPLTTNPPYGYLKDPEDEHHWIIDEEAAPVVKDIFSMCVAGKGSRHKNQKTDDCNHLELYRSSRDTC